MRKELNKKNIILIKNNSDLNNLKKIKNNNEIKELNISGNLTINICYFMVI